VEINFLSEEKELTKIENTRLGGSGEREATGYSLLREMVHKEKNKVGAWLIGVYPRVEWNFMNIPGESARGLGLEREAMTRSKKIERKNKGGGKKGGDFGRW